MKMTEEGWKQKLEDLEFEPEEELAFLRDEYEKLHRMVKTRDNKIKHLRQQLSESKMRKRLDQQSETIREQGQIIERLKREKDVLHEYVEGREAE